MNTAERVKSLKDHECIADVLWREASASQCRDCGKCVPGYEGVTQLEMIFHDITVKKGRSNDLALLQELCQMMKTQSLCEKGTELADAALQAMELYRTDLEDHIGKKACRAGVCRKFMTYHILADRCTGCGECMDACGEDAISGKGKFVHVIDQDECIQCGACQKACEEDAIITAGAAKPRCPQKPIPCKRK